MRKFKRIKVNFVRQKPATECRQEEVVKSIVKYYSKALREKDDFLIISGIENLLYRFNRNEIGSKWFDIGLSAMDNAEYLFEDL